jgi:hypothetical protein
MAHPKYQEGGSPAKQPFANTSGHNAGGAKANQKRGGTNTNKAQRQATVLLCCCLAEGVELHNAAPQNKNKSA